MKASRILIPVGVALIVFGLIFQLQGKGQIGPESSFMYYNKDWIYYGTGIIIFGIIACGVGTFFLRIKH
jgi:hypothetical protein